MKEIGVPDINIPNTQPAHPSPIVSSVPQIHTFHPLQTSASHESCSQETAEHKEKKSKEIRRIKENKRL